MHRLTLIGTLALAVACQGASGPSLDVEGAAGPLGSDGQGAPSNNSSSDTRCTGTLTGTFDNVVVPSGATCTLQGATVNGNVNALENARLFVSATQVRGNVEGDKASVVQVTGGTVGGNIQIKEGNSPSDLGAAVTGGTVVTTGDIQIEKMRTSRVLVSGARVEKGNIQITENDASTSLEILGNTVAQNLQVFKNRGGNKVVSSNTAGQAIQCKENTSPFTGGPNAAGETEAQCF
jgi:hypothetical protein